jgi:putative membrane protein
LTKDVPRPIEAGIPSRGDVLSIAAMVLVALIAALHVFIAWFEMFAWESVGRRLFRTLPDHLFGPTKVLAFNQGAYNALLVLGLAWSLVIGDAQWQRNVASCFLILVALAGLAGAVSASRRILFVQTVPALVAVALVWLT